MGSASRRVAKELDAIKKLRLKCFCDIQEDVTNIFHWKGRLVLDNPLYNKEAFWIEINFPCDYPFKPPTISFITKISHLNVNEKGEVCLPIISANYWKFETKIDQVILALVELINNPENSLRPDEAKEFTQDS
ncbi:hypothetical protein E2320_020613 [Naja naja]|uniref:UBC core domain-containing protein n=1 Tax=Naja naja TaxID=35670 RepID=A0A8C6X0Y6_NAJNA|nr:hypothetical protein E2320_020613 [Naja naja]